MGNRECSQNRYATPMPATPRIACRTWRSRPPVRKQCTLLYLRTRSRRLVLRNGWARNADYVEDDLGTGSEVGRVLTDIR